MSGTFVTVDELPYDVVDVFTDRAYGGNPLAVVHDAEHLAGAQMQQIAREFNLSETVFVLPPSHRGATYRVRIFSPSQEIPFAGHPSIGAAVALLRRGRLRAGPVVMQCAAGLRALRVHASGRAVLDGGAPVAGPAADPTALLAAVGLSPADLTGPEPKVVECGLRFPYLAVTASAVARAHCPPPGSAGVVAVLHWDAAAREAHARVFLPAYGVAEDAASGSAALGLGAWLLDAGLLPADGTSGYVVRQGAELGRPSLLECTVAAARGVLSAVTVGGHVAAVGTGAVVRPAY